MRAQLTERNTRLYWKSRCAAFAASERKLFARIYAAESGIPSLPIGWGVAEACGKIACLCR